jgi:hypothetical protein
MGDNGSEGATIGRCVMDRTQKHKREYDMFGPWIFQIESADDVPDAFEPYFRYDDTVEFAIKIPHHVERRNARPGDNLYDHLVACSPHGIAVFSLSSAGVRSWEGEYAEVVAIRTLHDLLHGELTFYMQDSRFTVPYNTVSEDMVEKVTAVVRRHTRDTDGTSGAATRTGAGAPGVSPAEVAYLYRSLIRRERERTGAIPIAYQETVPLEKREKHLFDPLLDAIRRISLRPALFLADSTSLVCYHAEPQIMRFGRGSYGYSRTEIPRGPRASLEARESREFFRCVDIDLVVPGHEIPVHVSEGFPVGTIQAVMDAL